MATLLEGADTSVPTDLNDFKAGIQDTVVRHNTTGDAIKAQLPNLVKGAGLAAIGSNTPLTDQLDITTRAHQAAIDLRTATMQGIQNKSSVVKSMNQGFLNQFGALRTALTAPSIGEQISQLIKNIPGAEKSFTAGNLGMANAA